MRKLILNILSFIIFSNYLFAQIAPEIIYDFQDGKIPTSIQLIDSRCEVKNNNDNYLLFVETGVKNQSVGINFIAGNSESWDFSKFAQLKVDIINYSDKPVTLWASIKGWSKTTPDELINSYVPSAVTLAAKEKGVINLDIYSYGQKLSTEEEIISGRGLPLGSGDLDPSKIKQISIYVKKSAREWKFGVDNIRLEGAVEVVNTMTFFPFIDSLGQYKHRNWLGKTSSISELKANAIAEKNILLNVSPNEEFDKYGGWAKGKKYDSTGFFHTKKINNKWWLIDPAGNLFFSHGVNGVGETAITPIDNREKYFEYFPSKDSEFAECWGSGSWAPHGYYKNHKPFKTFDFLRANLIKKYGVNWKPEYRKVTFLRFKNIGINTLGNWSEDYMYDIDSNSKIPYVVSGSSGAAKTIEGSKGWWRKFPDPFDKSFRKSVRNSLKKYINTAANDPFCIGFFVDNEQSWGDELSLSIATLKSSENQVAKIEFINGLKIKYGRIEGLNSSWKTEYSSWKDLLKSVSVPDLSIENVKNDLIEFYSKLAKEYFTICREEVKRIAPNQMYLGCRFSAEMMDNNILQLLSQNYCDVLTYNIYNLFPVGFTEKIDKPVIIGEFHFGALDRGMFHTGLWFAKNQDERAELYYNYVFNALKNPLIVGTHWFKYPAEPTTGRGDGENFQIGFTDICDKPYPELMQAVKKISSRMYQFKDEE